MTNKATNRFTLVLLALAFLAPAGVSYIAYLNMDVTGRTKNRGELVRPARPLVEFSLPRRDGTTYTRAQMTGKWTLVYIAGRECDEPCASALYKIRQSRMAQNENVRRVQRLLIIASDDPGPSYEKVLAAHSGMVVVNGSSAQLEPLLVQFRLAPKEDVVAAGRVYIVDPLGNLMMSYVPGFDPRDLVKDLQHLLKVSQVG
ncbi:MAG TPA: hypothetical protein ENJ01_10495 [Gammaproteobacteria bacterium]|nr:hypothetical protein [Gammaproteobacteria bacterium]